MADTEEYFPRGGKKPTVQYFKQSSNFLGSAEKGEKKKKKLKKKSEGDDGYLSDEAPTDVDFKQSYKNCAAGLSYKTAKAGVLVLGRVRQVHEMKLNVMLPCRLMGSVMACHISEPYNRLLDAYVKDQMEKVMELSTMFRPGQYVALKVLEADPRENRLMLSMMPQHVNAVKMHTDLHKGCVLQAAVSSVEDHGYVMDIGIPNTRAFLPKSDANPELELDTGMVTWCCVKTVEASASSVVTLGSELGALQTGVVRRGEPAGLLPASALDFTVDRPLENGIEGHVLSGAPAYIQRQHAAAVRGKKPSLGQKVRARVLYVMPTRNTPFLTTRNIFESSYPDLEEEQKFQEGDIVEEAQVIKISGRQVHFKLGRDSVGMLSLKRILVDEDLTDEEVVAKSYPISSTHKVRILCYHLCDYAYSVSDEPAVLSERYFSLRQLAPGQRVTALVRSVADKHITVAVGRLNGYVPHAHLSDAGVYLDPKKATTSKLTKKFREGQEVKARVLSVDPEKQTLFLTLKPTLLASDLEVLHSYQQAEIGKAYTGVIKFIREYVLVSFFNNVVAFVPRSLVTKDSEQNVTEAFHVGQIVNCTIINVDVVAKKMAGSFITSPFIPDEKIKKRHKRKQKLEETDTVAHKKSKSNEGDFEIIPDKKEKKTTEVEIDEGKEDANKKERKKKKDKKRAERSDDENKVSEESDAIETDIHEDSDHVLTPQDLGLIDLTDCVTAKDYKKRVVSLIKSIKARNLRLTNKIDKKIVAIEEKGLTARNKKYHTAMHMEKLVIQERIKKLMDVLTIAQRKLKELGFEQNTDYVKKKDKKKVNQDAAEEHIADNVVKDLGEKKKIKAKSKKIKVVDSLEPALDVPSAKNFWSANTDNPTKEVQEEELSSSDDEAKDQPKKKRKKLTVAEKVAKAREEEERVREMEKRAIESDAQPRSVAQFERALLANPDSSQLWIAYMAFHLQATEIEKARAVGRKALTTITFREEQERLNVWIALLNCEHRFGTKESQQKTLEEALQMNDTFKIHSALLDILVETGQPQELSGLVDLVQRKYKRNPATYTLCGAACFRLGLVEKARQVMQKAVSVLEKKEHVSVLVQFALLERSRGARERAEALFEQVLAVYPQRVDVCATYVDMLVKSGDTEHVRQVMERMTSQKLPARKMKVLFKKWIEVEEKIGDQVQAESIRQRALEYIDKAQF